MPLTPTKALLLDGLGGCLSAAALGLVLPAVQERIGLPAGLLRGLAALALLFAASSLTGHRLAGDRAPRWLRATQVANVAYCALTGALLVVYRRQVEPLGAAYLVAEVVVILGLVAVEERALRATSAPPPGGDGPRRP